MRDSFLTQTVGTLSFYGVITRSGSAYTLKAYTDAACTSAVYTTWSNAVIGTCSSGDSTTGAMYALLSNSVKINNIYAGDATCSVSAGAVATTVDVPSGGNGGSGICTSINIAGVTGSILVTDLTLGGFTMVGYAATGCVSAATFMTWSSVPVSACTATSSVTAGTTKYYVSTGTLNSVDAATTTAASSNTLAIGLGVGLGVGIPVVVLVGYLLMKASAATAAAAAATTATSAAADSVAKGTTTIRDAGAAAV